MTSSKHMQPTSSAFFPSMFIKNQFRSTTAWPPQDTNLSGKVAIVTGANGGLGLEASDQLLSLGLSCLIIAVRTQSKGETAARTLRAKHPKALIEVFQLDMSSYDSIQNFVTRVKQLERIDIAILNAGVRKWKLDIVDGTGHEETIQINYLSTALLCILLLPVLRQKSGDGPGRISFITSGLAFNAKVRNPEKSSLLKSFDQAETFDGTKQYDVSKVLEMMFLYKLADYVSAEDVIVNCIDPGFVAGTDLTKDLGFAASIAFAIFKFIAARSLAVGASTYVDGAVVKGRESHGCFLMSWELSAFPKLLYTEEGKQIIEKLWQETIAELSFANVQATLDGMKRTS